MSPVNSGIISGVPKITFQWKGILEGLTPLTVNDTEYSNSSSRFMRSNIWIRWYDR